jgi:sortase (surface protein transpeptidase)
VLFTRNKHNGRISKFVSTLTISTAGLAMLALTGCGTVASQQASPNGPIAGPSLTGADTSSKDPVALLATSKRTTTTRPAASKRKTSTPAATSSEPTATANAKRPRPLQLRLPSIQLNRAISTKPLKMDRKRKLESPKDTKSIGWYNAAGPLVLAGHVDSTSGPGVFYGLKRVKKGETFSVDFADGTSVSYLVSQVSTFPKNKFPTGLVYRANSTDIRIVTCGGKFNRKTRHYEDNVIVVASPVALT